MNLDMTVDQQIRFLSIPLMLKYSMAKGAFRYGIRTGLAANVAFSNRNTPAAFQSHHEEIHHRHTDLGSSTLSDLQRISLSYHVGLDLRYQVNPQMSISIEPGFRYGLQPIFSNEQFDHRIRSLNLGMGLNYRF